MIFASHQALDATFAEGVAEVRRDVARQFGALPAKESHSRLMLLTHAHDTDVAMYLDLAADLPPLTDGRLSRGEKSPTGG